MQGLVMGAAAFGALFAIGSQALFLAYFRVVNGLTCLRSRYAEAATEELRGQRSG